MSDIPNHNYMVRYFPHVLDLNQSNYLILKNNCGALSKTFITVYEIAH